MSPSDIGQFSQIQQKNSKLFLFSQYFSLHPNLHPRKIGQTHGFS